MKPRLAIVLGGLVLGGAGLWFAVRQPESAPTAGKASDSTKAMPVTRAAPMGPEVAYSPPARANSPVMPPDTGPASAPTPSIKATAPVPPPPARARPPDARADYRADLDNVRLMFRDYRSLMGENPVGSNAEIMKAIMGGNPKRAQLGPPEGQAVNGSGELVDRWGTPYFFHQMSATQMEIRSAGPDGIMWTSDDVLQR